LFAGIKFDGGVGNPMRQNWWYADGQISAAVHGSGGVGDETHIGVSAWQRDRRSALYKSFISLI